MLRNNCTHHIWASTANRESEDWDCSAGLAISCYCLTSPLPQCLQLLNEDNETFSSYCTTTVKELGNVNSFIEMLIYCMH